MLSRCAWLFCALLLTGLASLRADMTSPVIVQALPSESIARAGSAKTLNLGAYIQDPNVPGTAVRMYVQIGNLSSGNIDLALYDNETPLTVANFLLYVNGGYYANNIIHRSVPGFIFQGGEYEFSNYNADQLAYVAQGPAVQNEPGISNVAGTIAMAKISGNVNSATNQWFINLVDNSSNLDNQNGGFTAFGKILGNGMSLANQIASQITYNVTAYDFYSNGTEVASPPYPLDWTNMPLTAPNLNNTSFVQTSMAVIPPVTFTASSANTSLVTVGVSGNTLTLTPSSTNVGSTNITVTATDLEGAQLQSSFGVSVLDTYALWASTINFANITVAAATADPAGDGVTNLAKYAFGGDPLHATAIAGLLKMESGGGVTFYSRHLSAISYAVYESPDLVNWTLIWQSSDGVTQAAVHSVVSNVAAGFDALTIRDPAGGFTPIRFWRVYVTGTL
jgi:cyclophilin family peptidyl-prolyl cis-trans isomerase